MSDAELKNSLTIWFKNGRRVHLDNLENIEFYIEPADKTAIMGVSYIDYDYNSSAYANISLSEVVGYIAKNIDSLAKTRTEAIKSLMEPGETPFTDNWLPENIGASDDLIVWLHSGDTLAFNNLRFRSFYKGALTQRAMSAYTYEDSELHCNCFVAFYQDALDGFTTIDNSDIDRTQKVVLDSKEAKIDS